MSFFGDRLRECRENKGIGRQELAYRLGVSRNTVGLWERGERLPRSWELVCELADILGTWIITALSWILAKIPSYWTGKSECHAWKARCKTIFTLLTAVQFE